MPSLQLKSRDAILRLRRVALEVKQANLFSKLYPAQRAGQVDEVGLKPRLLKQEFISAPVHSALLDDVPRKTRTHADVTHHTFTVRHHTYICRQCRF